MIKRKPALPPAKPVNQSRRRLSEAVYRQVMEDETAPAVARLEAAKAYDALEHGRIGVNRQLELDDVTGLSDQDFERVFHACCRRLDEKKPNFLRDLIVAEAERLLKLYEAERALPKPEQRFTRDEKPAPPPNYIPQWPDGRDPRSQPRPGPRWSPPVDGNEASPASDPAPEPPAPSPAMGRLVPTRWKYDASAEGGLVVDEYSPIGDPPQAVSRSAHVSKPGQMSLPAPPTLGDSGPHGHGPGFIHPDVVARSAQPPSGMAMDLALRGFRPWWMR